MASPTHIEGMFERAVWASPERDWIVARVKSGGRLLTVVGNLGGAREGDTLKLTGEWVVDKKFGEQFKAQTCQIVTPATAKGIETYLGGGRFHGIGPEMAKRIVAKFGADTLKIIEKDPGRLAEVEGIGKVRAERLRAGMRDLREIQDVMVFLHGLGVSTAFAARIHRRYGAATIAMVRENPYRLALEVWGIGFKTADAVAQKLGIEKTSPARAEAGLLHVLGELVEEGHCHVPEHELVAAADKTLDVGRDILEPAMDRLVLGGLCVREELGDRGTCISRHPLWEAETALAARLRRLMATPAAPIKIDVEKALAWFEGERGITLAERQRDAVRAAVTDKVVIITGGPGVGKTTIVNAIIRILELKSRRIVLGAPTGRAAKRMSEATGRGAATLHRMLEFQPQSGAFARNSEHPLDADVVIVDEASMLDVLLARALIDAVRPEAKLILVGDVDQLPSVGPGRVLADVIASRRATVVRLNEIFRQAAASAIVTVAHKINRGEVPAEENASDFYFLPREEPADVLATILEVVAERIPRRWGLDAVNDVQVLSPMHRGEVGAANLNATLQARLNPARAGAAEIARGARAFRVGDKVIQLRNDYDKEVFNGDVGRVIDAADGELLVELDGRPVPYEAAEVDQLAHAYALTVHKAQGSEYPAVVVPVVTQHFMMLQRNLLYTAVTRGKKLVVLVGSRKALGIAVRSDDTRLRWTWLAERLREASLTRG